MPKLKSARKFPADTKKNKIAKAIELCFNFFRINSFLEGVKIQPPIENPLQIAQAHIPGVEADNWHGKIKR